MTAQMSSSGPACVGLEVEPLAPLKFETYVSGAATRIGPYCLSPLTAATECDQILCRIAQCRMFAWNVTGQSKSKRKYGRL